MKTQTAGLLCGVLFFAGAVQAIAPLAEKKTLEQIAPYLQDRVDEFPLQSIYKWQAVGADKVAVWSTIDDAYLLTVETPCSQLQTATDLGLAPQTVGIVARQSDSVIAGSDRCRILEIEPIDTQRMEGRPKKSADPV